MKPDREESKSTARQKRSTMSRGAPPAPRWETVPAGTAPAICTGQQKPGGTCRATVYWIERERIKNGKPVLGTKTRLPVDCAVDGGVEPNATREGRGVSHFATCPDARRF